MAHNPGPETTLHLPDDNPTAYPGNFCPFGTNFMNKMARSSP